MSPLERRVILGFHAEPAPRHREAHIASVKAPQIEPNRARRALGRSLVAVGSWLAAEPPRQPARTP